MKNAAVPPADREPLSGTGGEEELESPAKGWEDPGELPGPPPRTGAFALSLGVLAVVSGLCPWLPEAFPPAVRFFPLYLTVPLGICALVAGIGALRDARRVPEAGRGRARAAIVLGAVAAVVPVAVVVWGVSVLSI
ncbi:hypothetical protein AB0O18_30835 [Streptomyces sp. NPDC093224]|uniref:hypothetical protein n=1 Tax=Streptomyces sp. NPDC093224 TaxID=3155198 RepID=UPI00342700AC